jgi:hypothetical protein
VRRGIMNGGDIIKVESRLLETATRVKHLDLKNYIERLEAQKEKSRAEKQPAAFEATRLRIDTMLNLARAAVMIQEVDLEKAPINVWVE